MSDIQEAFEAHYFSWHGGGNMTFDHADSCYLDSDVNDYWLAFQAGEQAALSANGGEPLRYTNDGALAECPCCGSLDVGGAYHTVHCYNCDLTIRRDGPLQNAIDAWNKRAGNTHPAPPSVAVPDGLKSKVLELCSAVENDEDLPPVKYALKCGRLISEVKDILTAAPSPYHSGDAGKVAFVDGVGAQRMTAEECKEGIEYIIHGDNIYWPLSDDDELRLIQAACGNGEFTYPGASPSVAENEVKARALEEFARECGLFDSAYDDQEYLEIPRWCFQEYIVRLRTAGDEGDI